MTRSSLVFKFAFVSFLSFRKDGNNLRIQVPTQGSTQSDHYWVLGCYTLATGEFKQFNILIDTEPNYPTFCLSG